MPQILLYGNLRHSVQRLRFSSVCSEQTSAQSERREIREDDVREKNDKKRIKLMQSLKKVSKKPFLSTEFQNQMPHPEISLLEHLDL